MGGGRKNCWFWPYGDNRLGENPGKQFVIGFGTKGLGRGCDENPLGTLLVTPLLEQG